MSCAAHRNRSRVRAWRSSAPGRLPCPTPCQHAHDAHASLRGIFLRAGRGGAHAVLHVGDGTAAQNELRHQTQSLRDHERNDGRGVSEQRERVFGIHAGGIRREPQKHRREHAARAQAVQRALRHRWHAALCGTARLSPMQRKTGSLRQRPGTTEQSTEETAAWRDHRGTRTNTQGHPRATRP